MSRENFNERKPLNLDCFPLWPATFSSPGLGYTKRTVRSNIGRPRSRDTIRGSRTTE